MNNYLVNEPIVINNENDFISLFIKLAKEEIHDEWCVIKAMERGYLIHNGQIPIGTRLFQLDYYEENPNFYRLLCTSTLLEGVNTTAKNIIITKPSRKSDGNNNNEDFTAFDFFNLVGRTGRLYKHYIENAFYLKAPTDREYKKEDVIKSVKFELTDDSIDIDIQKGNINNHEDVKLFLKELDIKLSDYIENIGSRLRFETVRTIYFRYKKYKLNLTQELCKFLENKKQGRLHLVKVLYFLSEGSENSYKANIVNSLINKSRPRIKKVVDDTKQYFSGISLDVIISQTISIKMSYIEHQFYAKLLLIRYFMQLDKTPSLLIDVLEEKVINSIEFIYFSSNDE